MLRLQVKEPGEYLMIGEDVKIVFTGWSRNYLRVIVDAPKEVPVVRSRVAEKAGSVEPNRYVGDKEFGERQRAEEREKRQRRAAAYRQRQL